MAKIEDMIKKMTNLDMLKFMKKVNDQYVKENPYAAHILSDKTEEMINNVLGEAEKHENDPEYANIILNRYLAGGKTKTL